MLTLLKYIYFDVEPLAQNIILLQENTFIELGGSEKSDVTDFQNVTIKFL